MDQNQEKALDSATKKLQSEVFDKEPTDQVVSTDVVIKWKSIPKFDLKQLILSKKIQFNPQNTEI